MTIQNSMKTHSVIQSFFAQFASILVGKPVFKENTQKRVVVIFYYDSNSVSSLTETKANALALAITRLFKSKAVEVRLVQLRYPYLDSGILGQYLAINADKYNFTRMQKMIFRKMPTSGIQLELAGRLTTQRSIPRKTVETKYVGSFAGNLDFDQYASKNKLGAYTIKV